MLISHSCFLPFSRRSVAERKCTTTNPGMITCAGTTTLESKIMLDGDNTLPEDSVPDLRGVVDRLKSFDKFLGHSSSKDLDDILIADHNQSLLDLNESSVFVINKSTVPRQPVKYDGILEKILEKPALPINIANSTTKEASSSTSRSRGSHDAQKQKDSRNKALFEIGEDHEEDKQRPRDVRERHSGSRDNKVAGSRKSRSPHASLRSQKKPKDKSKDDQGITNALRTGKESENLPKVASSPSLNDVQQQHQRRRDKADSLSLSLHSKRHSRQGLYSSIGRRSDHGERRMTTKAKYQDLLSTRSEHVATSSSKAKPGVEMKRSSSGRTLSSTSNQEEEENQGQSHSPSCPRPRFSQSSRNVCPPIEMNLSSKDGQDEKKSLSQRSPRASRKPSSQIIRSRSTPRLSPQSRRSKKPSSSTNLVRDRESRPHGRRSTSSGFVDEQIATSSGNLRRSSSRRRLRKSGSLAECDEKSRNESLKRMDSLQSFFGSRGGSGIITTTPASQVKRLASSGDLRSPIPSQPPTTDGDMTNPSITQRTMNHLMLDLRRQTGRNLIQKFKSTRNLQAGVMDDILT